MASECPASSASEQPVQDGKGAASDSGSSYSSSGSRSRSRSPRGQPGPPPLRLGSIVELQGLAKAPELNGRRAVVTAGPDANSRVEVLCYPEKGADPEDDLRRVSVSFERLKPFIEGMPVRLRFRNVPGGYNTDILREEIEEECFAEGESFENLLFDRERGFAYLSAPSQRVFEQFISNFDGRRLERCGPGLFMPDSVLAQIVKVERL
eukprot:TRINITY_DN110052_c0_g1_i1.p1 TRINITY_DN110052_c0_g1~~TRINITY_DN110052_c0_g1_i1.p1  ORF type:complete len:225 (-),score=26.50 TRINITY_DN110052_c0_g1_i1:120-743(-)